MDEARRVEYFKQHIASLEAKLGDAMVHVLATQPADPLIGLASFLQQTVSAATSSDAAPPVATKTSGAGDASSSKVAWSVEHWLASLDLASALGAALVGEGCGSELDAVRALTPALVESRLSAPAVGRALAAVVNRALDELRAASAASGAELADKFRLDGNRSIQYGNVSGFFQGLDSLHVKPNPRVRETMQEEHCERDDSETPFVTNNYDLKTCSRAEFWFVVDPEGRGKNAPIEQRVGETLRRSAGWGRSQEGHCRAPRTLESFEAELHEKNGLACMQGAPLTVTEVLAARLWTGPMFMKYNAVARVKANPEVAFFQQQNATLNLGNTYNTTIHVINSAIVKASKLTAACTLYRGYSGVTLAQELLEVGSGGVDGAFQSWTKSKEAAFQYASSGGAGMVYEFSQGIIDRGADFEWLSQYPHEREITFGPLCGIEVLGTRVEGAVLVVSVRLNINLKARTLEQVVSEMKDSHLSFVDILIGDLRLSGRHNAVRKLIEIRDTSTPERTAARDRSPQWYNTAENFRLATSRVLDVKGELEYEQYWSELVACDASPLYLKYGNIRDFYSGLSSVLGEGSVAQAEAQRTMEAEHCRRADSQMPFSAFMGETNTSLQTTTSEIEWWYHVDPTATRLSSLTIDGRALSEWPTEETPPEGAKPMCNPRPCQPYDAGAVGDGPLPWAMARPLSAYDATRRELAERLASLNIDPLQTAELIALRLYSGPMYKRKYSAVLRSSLRPAATEILNGNTYAQTCHQINAAVLRLGKVSQAQTIYRGVGGFLDESVFKPNEYGITGIVDFSLIAATTDEATAVRWATEAGTRTGGGTVFAIHMTTDRGADVGDFSTYPELRECVLPACIFCEITGRRVRRNFRTAPTAELPEGLYQEGDVLYVDLSPQFQTLGAHEQ